jgi:flagellar motor switch protein FliM
MLGRAGMKQWISSATSQVSPVVRGRYEDALRHIMVDVRAELGRTHLPVSDLMALQEGDVVLLGRRQEDPVTVFVGTVEKFLAEVGKANQFRALRIVDVLASEPVQEDDELQ